MSKENKNKEKQRNSAGYVEPDRIVEKKKIACFVLLPRVRLRGGTHLGALVLSRSRSQCECLRVCVSFTTSHVPSHALPAFGG